MRWSDSSSPEPRPRVAAVVVAGGSGRRMDPEGTGARKQYLELLGEPILLRALRPFLAHSRVDSVVVVLPTEDAADPPAWLRGLAVRVVAGGAERGDSVWNGLAAVPADTEVVLIHDGARPLLTVGVVDRVLAAVGPGGAVPAVPVRDTLKEADAGGRVVGTADRSRLWHAQTPQGFPLPAIREAYARVRAEGWTGTDDASVAERCGIPVRLVEGSDENLKITRPADLRFAEALVRPSRGG